MVVLSSIILSGLVVFFIGGLLLLVRRVTYATSDTCALFMFAHSLKKFIFVEKNGIYSVRMVWVGSQKQSNVNKGKIGSMLKEGESIVGYVHNHTIMSQENNRPSRFDIKWAKRNKVPLYLLAISQYKEWCLSKVSPFEEVARHEIEILLIRIFHLLTSWESKKNGSPGKFAKLLAGEPLAV